MATKVLVVEDNQTEQQLLVKTLEANQFQVSTADDGEQALSAIAADPPDLVLLDIVLPKKDGFQVCREVKKADATRHVKIVMVSSKNQDSDRYWGLRQGADAYLGKPFGEQELLSLVRKLI
jgi:twitching motility two-component system response regulator PilH